MSIEFESDDGGWEVHQGTKYIGWISDEEKEYLESLFEDVLDKEENGRIS
jgi:hypothetical protein